MVGEARRPKEGDGCVYCICTQEADREQEVVANYPVLHLPTQSTEAPPLKEPVTTPNSYGSWRVSVQICEPLGDI